MAKIGFAGIASGLMLLVIIKSNCALDNGLALTPPMGWMSWERYRCNTNCKEYPDECISEKMFRDVADMLVTEGYIDVGYQYVIIDDCWLSHERDNNGRLQPDPERFPSGIKALADYVHSKGLKFGIYEDYGNKTCAGYPGLLGHLETDAQTFADWEVDYIKVDGCGAVNMDEGYPEFGRLLNQTGRPIVYSCSWPAYQQKPNFSLIAQHCNLWRVTYDISDSWVSMKGIVEEFAKKQADLIPYAGPGHWNDPDMLIIGNFGLSLEQSKQQMAIWAILAAPLIMSNDLHSVRSEYKEILQNKRIIAINQDVLGHQGRRVVHDTRNTIDVWARAISPVIGEQYSYALAYVNNRIDGEPYAVEMSLQEIGLSNPSGYIIEDLFGDDEFQVTDLSEKLRVRINPSGVVFYKATPISERHFNKMI